MNIDENDSLERMSADLALSLHAVSSEFASRAERIAEASRVRTGPENGAELSALALQMLKRRRARLDHFPCDLFHEPAWNMLLALFIAHHQKRVTNVKALIAISDAPTTTCLRWIDHLAAGRLIDRTADPADRRRVDVSLSDIGLTAMTNYLTAIALQ